MAIRKSGERSPVSPFHFNKALRLSSVSSVSGASSIISMDNDFHENEQEQNRGSFSVYDDINMPDLIQVQARLRKSIHKAQELREALRLSDSELQDSDGRLLVLQEVVSVVQSQVIQTKGLGDRIDGAIEQALGFAALSNSLHKMKPVIGAGPRGDIGTYLIAISQVEDLLVFVEHSSSKVLLQLQETVDFVRRSSTTDKFSIHKLNETVSTLRQLQAGQEHARFYGGLLGEALDHLETEFKRILTEDATVIPLPISSESTSTDGRRTKSPSPLPALPVAMVQVLQAIANKLAATGRLNNCLKIFEDARSLKAEESLQTLRADYVYNCTPEAVDKEVWLTLEGHIALWTQQMDALINVLFASERRFCKQVFSSVDENMWIECFGNIARRSGLDGFFAYGEAVTHSQKEPAKLFKLLDMLDMLDKLKLSVKEVFKGDGSCCAIRERFLELKDALVEAACIVFWEFGSQVEGQKEGSIPSDGTVLKLVSYVVNYLKFLLTDPYKFMMSQALAIRQSHKSKGQLNESDKLSLAVQIIMEALDKNVETRAAISDDRAFYHFFLMNYHWYIYTRFKKSELGFLLGATWVKQRRHEVEKCVLKYQKHAWTTVLRHLSMEGLQQSGSSKKVSVTAIIDKLRQRIRAFEVAFEDIYDRHNQWLVASDDLRQQIHMQVVQVLVSGYSSYLRSYENLLTRQQQHQEQQQQHQQQRRAALSADVKYSPRDLESMIAQLFNSKREAQQ